MRIHVDVKSVLGALGRAMALFHAGVSVTDVVKYDAVQGKTGGTAKVAKEKLLHSSEQKLEEAVAAAKSAYMTCPDWGALVDALRENKVHEVHLTTFIPVVPMLGKPCKSLKEIVAAMRGQPFVADYKYDGQRAQVHLSDGEVRVFSRHRKNATEKFGDIRGCVVAAAAEGVHSFILDAEVVAIDRSQDPPQVLPFQTLQTIKTGPKSGSGAATSTAAEVEDHAGGGEADEKTFPTGLQLCVM